MLQEYRKELENLISQYLEEQERFFEETFVEIKKTCETGDIDGFIAGTNKITEHFGKVPLFSSKAEFETIMGDDVPIRF